ncbi:MAG: 50S ribosomal protein L23 [Candidatus Daviesbacteria bacterium]|nr:50S ribosomal protein L23 [Candidatus Daviesbacteria bacterium]
MIVLKRPIITEKSMNQAGLGKFTFEVVSRADKKNIKQAIEEKFKVTVISVATNIVKGKTARVGKRRAEITKSSWKKAIVGLAKGQKIDLFEQGAQQ